MKEEVGKRTERGENWKERNERGTKKRGVEGGGLLQGEMSKDKSLEE